MTSDDHRARDRARDGIEAAEMFRQHADGIRCVQCGLTISGQ